MWYLLIWSLHWRVAFHHYLLPLFAFYGTRGEVPGTEHVLNEQWPRVIPSTRLTSSLLLLTLSLLPCFMLYNFMFSVDWSCCGNFNLLLSSEVIWKIYILLLFFLIYLL